MVRTTDRKGTPHLEQTERTSRVPESLWARRSLWASLLFFPAVLITIPLALRDVLRDKQRGNRLIIWAAVISVAQIFIILGLIWAAQFWLAQNPNALDLFPGIL